jgi:hypothetical protein
VCHRRATAVCGAHRADLVTHCFVDICWSGRQDLNLRPLDPQSTIRPIQINQLQVIA